MTKGLNYSKNSFAIGTKGEWVSICDDINACCPGVKTGLCDWVSNHNISSFVDFGCGNAVYSREISNLFKDIDVEAYDGNPYCPINTGGFGSVLDLSEPFNLNKKFDVVLCLEVGEHIPKQYEKTLINNLINHANDWIILSWAVPGQGGAGHVNEQTNEYILDLFENRGFAHEQKESKYLRDYVTGECWWFMNTIMVFRNNK